MNHLRTYIFLLTTATVCSPLWAQNFSKDLSAINAAYFNLEKHIELKTTVKKNGEITTQQTVHSYMRGIDDYYMKNETSEVLIQSGIRVAVNTAFKVVLLDSNGTESLSSLPISLFDTISTLYADIQHSVISSDKSSYTLVPKYGPSKRVKIDYWNATKLIDKVEVSLENPRSEDTYYVVNTYTYSNLLPADMPALSSYITTNNSGEISLQQKWSAYELVNNITQ